MAEEMADVRKDGLRQPGAFLAPLAADLSESAADPRPGSTLRIARAIPVSSRQPVDNAGG